jgi:farnesyl diphosphate synthase
MMTKPDMSTFADSLRRWQADTEMALAGLLPDSENDPARLHQAMRYGVLGGGKRVRPALVYATAAALQLPQATVTAVACAVEMIHAYSLIHDDLPAMDDDDLRRGRATRRLMRPLPFWRVIPCRYWRLKYWLLMHICPAIRQFVCSWCACWRRPAARLAWPVARRWTWQLRVNPPIWPRLPIFTRARPAR